MLGGDKGTREGARKREKARDGARDAVCDVRAQLNNKISSCMAYRVLALRRQDLLLLATGQLEMGGMRWWW